MVYDGIDYLLFLHVNNGIHYLLSLHITNGMFYLLFLHINGKTTTCPIAYISYVTRWLQHCFIQFLFSSVLAAMADSAGLFAPEPAADNKRKILETTERRTKLKDADSVAPTLFTPWEKSALAELTPADIWRHVKEGYKYVAFHSELAATETTGGEYSVGVGLSRSVSVHALASQDQRRPCPVEDFESGVQPNLYSLVACLSCSFLSLASLHYPPYLARWPGVVRHTSLTTSRAPPPSEVAKRGARRLTEDVRSALPP